MTLRSRATMFYETRLDPAAIFSTEAVALSSLPAGEARTLARRLDLSARGFHQDVAFRDLLRLSVFYRTYSKTAAGAVLWIEHHPVATLGLFDQARDRRAIRHFHQGLAYLARRNSARHTVLPKARLPKLRPALFIIGMNGGDVAQFPSLHALSRALMAAFLHRNQRTAKK